MRASGMCNRRTIVFVALLTGAALPWGCSGVADALSAPAGVPPQYESIPKYDEAAGMTGLKALTRVDPMVSDEFRRSRSSASATVEAVVGPDGRVIDAYYMHGDPQWGAILVQAVRGWTFSPAQLDGNPITVRFELRSNYSGT